MFRLVPTRHKIHTYMTEMKEPRTGSRPFPHFLTTSWHTSLSMPTLNSSAANINRKKDIRTCNVPCVFNQSSSLHVSSATDFSSLRTRRVRFILSCVGSVMVMWKYSSEIRAVISDLLPRTCVVLDSQTYYNTHVPIALVTPPVSVRFSSTY